MKIFTWNKLLLQMQMKAKKKHPGIDKVVVAVVLLVIAVVALIAWKTAAIGIITDMIASIKTSVSTNF